ncbi:hypothetical protein BU26DRAFT_49579 [Trematosphaeria pertusa]|uniref:Uncharacterized protein n=1 Tax=Trematosphaeria pertusa TaxID=390896 RepID=A0A6A6I918_9PLEO|nr:uncharacterized protein BU26DRAFT_49579 [Trematosphaeria pertusa]KAF2246578.1 hypothetical protein BU26DRAFT_49579 [Trematosphaeria pertusa]
MHAPSPLVRWWRWSVRPPTSSSLIQKHFFIPHHKSTFPHNGLRREGWAVGCVSLSASVSPKGLRMAHARLLRQCIAQPIFHPRQRQRQRNTC